MLKYQPLLAGILSSLLMVGCSSQKNNSEIARPSEGIIGGQEVSFDDDIQKSIVAVYDSQEGQLCTGTLISENIVVTAAHCIGSDSNKMYIFFGRNILNDGSIYRAVDRIEISPYWNPGTTKKTLGRREMGDVAVIRFIGTTPPYFKPAALLENENKKSLFKGTQVLVAGYGVSEGKTREGLKVLRRATVTLEDPLYTRSEILLNQESGHGACHGDSGGPAFVQINGEYYLSGIISRGIKDEDETCTSFSAVSSVPYYRPWLNRMIIKMSGSLLGPASIEDDL